MIFLVFIGILVLVLILFPWIAILGSFYIDWVNKITDKYIK